MARLQSLYSLVPAFSILFGNMVASAPTDVNGSTVQPQFEYLFQANVSLGDRIDFGSSPGPLGTRVSVPNLGGVFTGPAMSGEMLSIGSEWGLIDAKGTFSVNAYWQLRTSDNVNIFGHSEGPPQPANPGDRIKTRIILETGDENYYWVNNLLIVAISTLGDHFLTIDAWQVTQGD